MLRKLICLIALIGVWASCSENDLLLENGSSAVVPSTGNSVSTGTIKISASVEGQDTRTTLNGMNVLWDEGDEFKVVNEYVPTLQVTVNGTSQALGINISDNKSEAQVKYSYLSVLIGGKDKTAAIIQSSGDVSDSQDNEFKIGIPNKNDKYKYGAAGTPVSTAVKSTTSWFTTTRTIPFLRASSSSDFTTTKTAIVTFQGLQYSYDGSNWVNVTESSTFNGGSKWGVNGLKDVSKYEWLKTYGESMHLTSESGKRYGDFEGNSVDINDKTRVVYPTSALQSYKDGMLSVSIPEHQTYVENSFDHHANVMIGDLEKTASGKYNAQFRNMMGVLQLSLTGDNFIISSITITDKSRQSLWGTAAVPAGSYANGISTDMITNGGASLTLDCPGVLLAPQPKTFYFVVPIGALAGGFDITVKDANNNAFDLGTGKNNLICRSDIRQMPQIQVEEPSGVFNIENEATQIYLNQGPYSKWGASTYFNSTTKLNSKGIDQDYPNAYLVSWMGNSADTYYITFTDRTNGKDVFTQRAVTGSNYSLVNMIPEHVYSYKVTDNSNTTLATGKFKATGRMRWIKVDDTWNFRDLGGWTGLNGRKVAYEWIYRCGSLNGEWTLGTNDQNMYTLADPANYNVFSATSRQQLEDIGVKGELDLRAIPDEEKSTKTDKSHAYSLDIPHTGIDGWIFKRIMTNNGLNTPKTYYSVVQDVAWIIDQVVNKNNPVAFHCKSGADRTGAVGFTILALLGVSEGNITLEFELTNMSHEQKIVKGKPALRGKYSGGTSKVPQEFYSTAGFTTLGKGTWQENAYYYLNQYFASSGIAINSTDLDRFIEKMLNMPAGSYTHPSFAVENSNSLESIYANPQTNKVQ